MNAVSDSSVLVAAFVDSGPHGIWAEKMLADGPLLERAKHIGTAEANAADEDLMQPGIKLLGFEPFADPIRELRHTITSYDAWYVAAAEALKLPLATLDVRLAKAAGPTCAHADLA